MSLQKLLFTLMATLCLAGVVLAQDQDQNPEVLETQDILGRDTPRGMMTGFLEAIEQGDAEIAAEYLDLRNLPSAYSEITPENLALGLSIILARSTWIDLISYSDAVAGESNDGLPSYRDELAVVDFQGESLQLLLQRVPGENGTSIWKVSNASIARLLDLYEQYRYNAYVEWLLLALPAINIFGFQLYAWVATLTITLAIAPLVLLLAWLTARLVVKPERPIHGRVQRFLMVPVSTFILWESATAIMGSLGTGLPSGRQEFGGQLLSIFLLLWIVMSILDLAKERYARYLINNGRETSVALLGPLATSLKTVVVLLGVLQWMDNLGYEITALLAGLGVGGIAVALVLQKPLEDIFGAITLYTQQPIKLGDFGKFGDKTGTVEEISLRSTRIRTLDNTVVAVPNTLMASQPIENYSSRQKILYQPLIRLHHKTKPKQIKEVLESLRQLLADDEMVIDEGARVRFTEIGEEAHELQVFAYINATDYPVYLEAAEQLNFGVLEIIEKAGVQLAAPMPDILRTG